MRKIRNLFAMLMFIVTGFVYPATQDSAPFNYVFGKAYHILPGTHNKESGYFSLCEGLDGKIYIGTTKYNENSFLVEFDPYTEKQKIVIDTHKVCGIQATGYAAQAKIHTKNFVAPSGRIYVGSKEGYRSEGDNSEYPGGYVMVYDPGTQKAESLGMPQPNEGIIDVVADEGKKLLYVVTSEGKHWFVYDMKTKKYRQIGTMLSPYATTLIDKKGRAHVITKDFKIATYTPETDSIVIRPIIISGKVFTYPKPTITYWVLASDKKTAYMTMMSDSQLYEIILPEKEKTVKGKNLGRMIQGSNPDCRSSLCIHPDGRVYCLWRIFNETGFGSGNLHHLIRYNPKNKKMEDLGVIAVKNPDYFDFNSHALGNPLTFSHGFHKLPDGTLTPLYEHMAMIATRDGTLYITILYPFTLLKIDQFTIPEKNLAPGDFGFAAKQYFKAVLDACDRVESHLLEITQTAEIIADRHINGGLIGFYPSNYQGFEDEFWGRSGGMVNMGFDRPFKQNRTPEEKKLDVSLIGWQRKPIIKNEALMMKSFKDNGGYIVGFGPKQLPELAEQTQIADVWFDTGTGADDRCVCLADGSKAGRTNHLINALNGWALTAEIFSAITRQSHTPAMWKSFVYADGGQWGNKYLYKKQFMDEYPVASIDQGQLAKAFLDGIRYHVRKFENTQMPNIEKALDLITKELLHEEKIHIASMGHMPWTYVGKYEDAQWAVNNNLHSNLKNQVINYLKDTPDKKLVVFLGYTGMDPDSKAIFNKKKQKVVLISAENDEIERPDWQIPNDVLVYIDMGYSFGDACVYVEGLPIRILPPSGIMQIVAYESLNVEILSRLSIEKTKNPGIILDKITAVQ